MNWIELESADQIEKIKLLSKTSPVAIFKHSTRCSISHMAKTRLERIENEDNAQYFFLDLIARRPLSNQIAEEFHVHHESPQLLIIVNGECVYEESHNGINAADTLDEVKRLQKQLASN